MEPMNDRGAGSEQPHEDLPPPATSPQPGDPMIVGIGASAGGLEALERLFSNLPDRTGMAFVVVQHLSPDFRSLMDELLARHTNMTIRQATDGMPLAPDTVHLMPPRKDMSLASGRLRLTDRPPQRDLSLPIDHFFRSLAEDAGPRAIAVVLSGTGSDGSRGIRDVHAAGGLVIVQTSDSAQFDGMPKSAQDTGVADFTLDPEAIARELVTQAEHARSGRPGTAAATAPGGAESIFTLLRDDFGIDFSYYKPSTIGRRIERRQALTRLDDLDAYVARLREDGAERNALYRDLLIGVTRFFRDPEAFERLEREVLPALLARRSPDEELRVWVAGCATGEEAYSLAILLDEQLRLLPRRPKVKIFASDAHPASLEVAASGVYDEDKLAALSPARLERYFVKRADGYHVSSELRQMIVFTLHNVIADAPFTRLDLISCRNLLIYFQQPVQRRVLALFHFALRTGGVLLLGPSEGPGDLADELEDVDSHWKIFRKRRDVRLPHDLRQPLAMPQKLRAVPASAALGGAPEAPFGAYEHLLEHYLPPGVLVTERRRLVHTFGDTGTLLALPRGRATTDLLDLVPAELRVPVAAALQRATKEGQRVTHPPVYLRSSEAGGADLFVRLTVEPIYNRHGHLTNFFIALDARATSVAPAPEAPSRADDEQAILTSTLEAELHLARENLQATVEELETSNEELQTSNEELVASNEELQSTNEELHSVNQELYTVNAEYQRKIQELLELTEDMDNLLRSTDIGTIFLDRDLCIRKFTPQIGRTFDLRPHDVGRRIEGFSHNIRFPRLHEALQRVLATGERIETDVQDQHGNWLFLRVLPYESRAEAAGVVLSLIDIAPVKRAEQRVAQLSAIVESSDDAIIGTDLEGRIHTWNGGATRLFGYDAEEATGAPLALLHAPESPEHQPDWGADTLARMRAGVPANSQVETVRRRKSGETIEVLVSCSAIRDGAGVLTGASIIARDVSARRTAERALETSNRELERTVHELANSNRELLDNVARREEAESEARAAVDRRDRFLAILSHELRNPLAAILNAARLLERGGDDERVRAQAQGAIGRQSRQMARLLDDLLDVSRITRNKIEIRKEAIDLGDAAREASELVRAQAAAREQRLRVELAPQPVCVDGDPARLQQIVVNLLTNAVKYTPRGGDIALSVAQEGSEALLRVRDSGPGIPLDKRDKIFELFFQLQGAVGSSDGSMGVGLTLVRSLVSLHGGSVCIEDTPGGGSTFVVRLPLAARAPHRPAPETASSVLDGLRIAVIEDNDDIRTTTAGLLRDLGCTVSEAEDGRAGLAVVEQQHPEVALVDIGMPGLSGYDVARRIRAGAHDGNGHRILLIALTGFGQEEDRARARAAGFDAHLVKPIDFDQLSTTIERLRR